MRMVAFRMREGDYSYLDSVAIFLRRFAIGRPEGLQKMPVGGVRRNVLLHDCRLRADGCGNVIGGQGGGNA